MHVRLLALLLLALSASGCAAAALPAVGMAAMSGGTSSVVKAGVEHTIGGKASRTFTAPLVEVREAVRQTFRDLQIKITQDDLLIGDPAEIVGEARNREIHVALEPVTPMLTRLTIVVKQGWLGRDPATAAELIGQTSQTLELRSGGAAASPRAP